jgi:hypothetical protein
VWVFYVLLTKRALKLIAANSASAETAATINCPFRENTREPLVSLPWNEPSSTETHSEQQANENKPRNRNDKKKREKTKKQQ